MISSTRRHKMIKIYFPNKYFEIQKCNDLLYFLLGDAPSTLMGQFMEALNNQAIIDDLGLNIDSFHGGLPNVDEVSGDLPVGESTGLYILPRFHCASSSTFF